MSNTYKLVTKLFNGYPQVNNLVSGMKIMFGKYGYIVQYPNETLTAVITSQAKKLRTPEFDEKFKSPQYLDLSEAGFAGMAEYLGIYKEKALQAKSGDDFQKTGFLML